MRVRTYPGSPIIRLQYRLTASKQVRLTKVTGKDNLRYFRLSGEWLAEADLTEYQLSHFDPVAHSYMPNLEAHSAAELRSGLSFVGPVAWLHTRTQTLLAAYEHGADHPDSFFDFRFEFLEGQACLSLAARKGNYYAGQQIGPEQAWESAWLELGLEAQPLGEFMQRYRQFFLNEVCENTESRKPNIYYNTWNYQERKRYFNGRPYLETMHYDQMMAEIEVAHRLGVDVFVIDTGWYIKTGDWQVNRERFPDGLQEVRRKLEGYGMKLGLWFNPTVAALTSRIFQEHPEYQMTRNGKPLWQGPVWETEESTAMCLASGYADDFIETMVRLHQELGVSYYKWDAVSQYGCEFGRARPRHAGELHRRTAGLLRLPDGQADDPHRGGGDPALPGRDRGLRHHGGRALRGVGLPLGRQVFPGQQRTLFQRLRHPALGQDGPGHDQRVLLPGAGAAAHLPAGLSSTTR